MKKFLSILLTVCLILSLAACAADGSPPSHTGIPSEPTEPISSDPTSAPTAPPDITLPEATELPVIPTDPPSEGTADTVPTDTATIPSEDETVTEPTEPPVPSVSEPEASEAPPSPTDPDATAPTAGTNPSQPTVTEPDISRPTATAPVITEPPIQRPLPTDPPATDTPGTIPSVTRPVTTVPAVTDPAPTSPPATRPEPTSPTRPTAPVATDPPVTDPPATQPPTAPRPTDCAHRYALSATQSATCTNGEIQTYTCSKCGHSYSETVGEPVPHSFADATCTQPQICTACGTASGAALGHRYNTRAICTRCGEPEPGPIELVIKVKNTKGALLSGVTVRIFIDDLEVGSAVTDKNGEARLTVDHLEPYQVRLSDLPANVTANSSYSFSAKQANINLPTQPVLDPLDHSQADYQKGSTMADFTLSDTDGNTYRLYELLDKKELVILDFWYCTCAPCKKEFPYFDEALQRYGENMALLALNPLDPLENIISLREELGCTFPMLRDTVNLYKGFNVTAYPVTVFIDGDGKVLNIHRGAYSSQEQFFRDIEKYL